MPVGLQNRRRQGSIPWRPAKGGNMKKEKTKKEQCKELIELIDVKAQDISRLIKKASKPNRFLVRDLLALIVHMREDIRTVIDKQLFEE